MLLWLVERRGLKEILDRIEKDLQGEGWDQGGGGDVNLQCYFRQLFSRTYQHICTTLNRLLSIISATE